MPEGDSVALTARRLHRALAGRELTRAELRVPRLATADLVGRQVTEVLARGKHLLIRLSGQLTLHCRLGMPGSWYVGPPTSRPRGGRTAEIRAVLANRDHQAIGFRLPLLQLIRTRDEDQVVGHLGPDLLGPDWDAATAVARLMRDPARPVGEALLDQRALAGVGNIYKNEALFLRGVWPWVPVGEVADLPSLVDLLHRLLAANRDRAEIVTSGDRRRGRQLWVHGRSGLPCRRCGAGIERAPQGVPPRARTTFFCPRCQPEPGRTPEETDRVPAGNQAPVECVPTSAGIG